MFRFLVPLSTGEVIEVEEELVPWAAAGSNATLYLSGIDPIHLRWRITHPIEYSALMM